MAVNPLYGRTRRFASRRLIYLVLAIILFAYSTITIFSPIPIAISPLTSPDERIEKDEPIKPKSPVANLRESLSKGMSGLNPFRGPSHPPAMRAEDSYHGTSWFADWKWLSVPFSSSLTLDDDRALLPPLRQRPFIYCYYDATLRNSREEKDAESKLLLTWRRAWWARGFRPTIIGASEAMNNPIYPELQRLDIKPALKDDLMRWLAWEAMGTGVLADCALFPMAQSEDPLLTFLRRGEYPAMTRWKGFDSALIVGPKDEVSRVIRKMMDSPDAKTFRSVIDGTWDSFKMDKTPDSVAYYSLEMIYSLKMIKSKYSEVHDNIVNSRAKGIESLNRLVNAHLHIAWQSSFPDGIEVIQPLPEHTTDMVAPALKLANSLASCPNNPIPSSCPPGSSGCKQCAAGTEALEVGSPEGYQNSSRIYSIGTVPHPWTLATVSNLRENINVTWIRKESPRDPWLETVTKDILGEKVSSNLRIMRFKQAVADEHAPAHALWLTAEAGNPQDLDWHFGFRIPEGKGEGEYDHKDNKLGDEKRAEVLKEEEGPEKSEPQPQSTGETAEEIPKEAKQQLPPPPSSHPSPEEASDDNFGKVEKEVELTPREKLAKERDLLDRAKRVVALTKPTTDTRLRASLEAWNLADTEAWKFARAFLARQSMERAAWEKQEARYSGGAGSEKGRSAWSRWKDSKEESRD
ncbi:hypothetical protein FZEAL_7749 [Fusarium zealandicum]|uniref:Uncharacterized protein n=1 Tax=Fusarium zealandicum TaxID=1053134 RepID=A0A8H4UFU2_9HYPO|nr:hypothetical protein FZEAL_7749 [Fusarium zealandicum]